VDGGYGLNTTGKKQCTYFCDGAIWYDWKTDESSFACGCPSLDMFVDACNIWAKEIEGLPVLGIGKNGQYHYTLTVNGEGADYSSSQTFLKNENLFVRRSKWYT